MQTCRHAAVESAEGLRGRFLEAMSHTASTVSIVTTDGPAGRAGLTVSAMVPVSADAPAPLLLVCLHRAGSACPVLLENRVFSVNVLRDDQTAISDIFAGRLSPPGGDRFACAAWTTGRTGAPRLLDPLVAFDCRLIQSALVGTHHVVFGAVADIFIAPVGGPLIYTDRRYGMASRADRFGAASSLHAAAGRSAGGR